MTTENGLPPGLIAVGQCKAMAFNDFSGKKVPTADALLNRAHRDAQDRGWAFVGQDSELVVVPQPPQMFAVVRVTVHFKSLYEAGQPVYKFSALGDADTTTGTNVKGRILALAETRARTRALGSALNSDEENADANAGAPAQAYAQPLPPGYVPPAAYPGAPTQPGVYQGFTNGMIPFGKHKGKHLTDPSIPLADIQWFCNLTTQDKVTPDQAKRNDAMAEVQRRMGAGAPVAAPVYAAPAAYAPAPVAPVYASQPQPGYPPAPMAAPIAAPPPPIPAAFAPAPLPPAPGVGVFPPGLPAPVAAAPVALVPQPVAPVAAPVVNDPNQLGRIAQRAAAKGYPWPQLVSYVATTYGVADPAQLQPAQLQQLEQSFA